MVLPLRIDRTGGTGKVQEFNPTSETLDVRVLPSQLPNDWSEFADGHTFSSGDQVWYLGRLYSCDAQHNKVSATTPNDTGNWQFVGGNLTATSGSSGQSTVNNVTRLDIGLNISRALSGSSVGLGTNASGDLADYTINLDPDDFSTTAGVNLTNQKVSLFLGTTTGTISSTSEQIAGSLRNFQQFITDGTPYYFITGVSIDHGTSSFVDGGNGIWTTDIPTGTVTVANSANLIG